MQIMKTIVSLKLRVYCKRTTMSILLLLSCSIAKLKKWHKGSEEVNSTTYMGSLILYYSYYFSL